MPLGGLRFPLFVSHLVWHDDYFSLIRLERPISIRSGTSPIHSLRIPDTVAVGIDYNQPECRQHLPPYFLRHLAGFISVCSRLGVRANGSLVEPD